MREHGESSVALTSEPRRHKSVGELLLHGALDRMDLVLMLMEHLKKRIWAFHRVFEELIGFQRKEEGDRTRLAIDRSLRIEFNVREPHEFTQT